MKKTFSWAEGSPNRSKEAIEMDKSFFEATSAPKNINVITKEWFDKEILRFKK